MVVDFRAALNNLVWAIPAALAVIALMQIVYATYLAARGEMQERSSRPTRPVMPSMGTGWSSSNLPGGLPAILAQASRGLSSSYGVSGDTDDGSLGKFVVTAGLADNREMLLPSSHFGIGRFYNKENNVIMPIDEKSISRQHADFAADEALREYYLKDTGSTYGTFLMKGGQFEQLPPNTQVRVYNEDIVQFGSKVRVRLVLPTETRAEAIR